VRQHAIALSQRISDLTACTHETQARDDPSPDALLHGSAPLPHRPVRGRPACQARAVLGQRHPGRPQDSLPGGAHHRPRARPGAGSDDQARDQAGGPAAVQPGDRHRRRAAPLGALRCRTAHEHQRGHGLDRVRRRWSGHPHAVTADAAWPRHAARVADGGQSHLEGPPQRIRVSGADTVSPTLCPRTSRCASWPTAGSAITSSTGC